MIDYLILMMMVNQLYIPRCDLNMIWAARSLRTCLNGGSWSMKKDMKKGMKEKGVMERIRH